MYSKQQSASKHCKLTQWALHGKLLFSWVITPTIGGRILGRLNVLVDFMKNVYVLLVLRRNHSFFAWCHSTLFWVVVNTSKRHFAKRDLKYPCLCWVSIFAFIDVPLIGAAALNTFLMNVLCLRIAPLGLIYKIGIQTSSERSCDFFSICSRKSISNAAVI